MEKSVVLELIKERDYEFETLIYKINTFNVSEMTCEQINELFVELANIKHYVENSKLKESTLNKINEAITKSREIIACANDYVKEILKQHINNFVLTASNEQIEKAFTKDLMINAEKLEFLLKRDLISAVDGEFKLSKTAIDALDVLRKNQKVIKKADIEVISNIEIGLYVSYLHDSKSQSDDKLPGFNFNESSEEEQNIQSLLESIMNSITSKKGQNKPKGKDKDKDKGKDKDKDKGKGKTKGHDNDKEKQQEEEDPRKVKKIEKADKKQKKRNRRIIKKLVKYGIIGGIALAAIIWLLTRFNSCSNNQPTLPYDYSKDTNTSQTEEITSTPEETTTPVSEEDIELLVPVVDFDVNDDVKLTEHAKELQSILKELDVEISVDDIKNAIKVVNVDSLNNPPFTSREEVYNAIEDAGVIGAYLTSDSIVNKSLEADRYMRERVLDDMIANVVPSFDKSILELNITGNGYDVYEINDKLVNIIRDETKDNDVRKQAAMLLNEFMARKGRTFTITNNSTVGQHYYFSGIYNFLANQVDELTAGQGYGPCYGDGKEIDGKYGFICVEELIKYFKIGNINNMFYTEIADLLIVPDKVLCSSAKYDASVQNWAKAYIKNVLDVYAAKSLELDQPMILTKSL